MSEKIQRSTKGGAGKHLLFICPLTVFYLHLSNVFFSFHMILKKKKQCVHLTCSIFYFNRNRNLMEEQLISIYRRKLLKLSLNCQCCHG